MWVAIIIIGGAFVTYDERLKVRAFWQPAVFVAILGIFFSAATGILTNRAIADTGYWAATFWPLVIVVMLTAGTYPLFRKDLPSLTLRQMGAILILAIIEVAGILAINKAFMTNVGITSAIVNLPLSMAVAMVLSRVAPTVLEKHSTKVYAVRLVAAAVMIGAATRLTH